MTDHELLHFQSLSSICRQLKSGALSSVTLTQYMFERIHKLTGQTLSFARLLEEQALATAAARDEARAQAWRPRRSDRLFHPGQEHLLLHACWHHP